MLYLNGEQKIGDDNQHLNGAGAWKILVYDDYCQNILAPLFNVQELREKGITLHLYVYIPYINSKFYLFLGLYPHPDNASLMSRQFIS